MLYDFIHTFIMIMYIFCKFSGDSSDIPVIAGAAIGGIIVVTIVVVLILFIVFCCFQQRKGSYAYMIANICVYVCVYVCACLCMCEREGVRPIP